MGKSSGAPSPNSANTTTTSQGPPAAWLNAYQGLVNNATTLASKPYQPYPGTPQSLVAPFTPNQLQGFSETANAQGMSIPFTNAGAQAFGAATQPLWQSLPQYNTADLPSVGGAGIGTALSVAENLPSNVPSFSNLGTYFNPYQQYVTGATQNLFNEQNAEQLSAVRGNAAAQNAFGGDREAIAEAETARQQQLAEAPTLAGIQAQGFGQAEQELGTQQDLALKEAQLQGQLGLGAGQAAFGAFGQQQQSQLAAEQANAWLNSQAGFGLGALGTQAENQALTGAQALSAVGAQQQGLGEQYLNIPYEQYVAEQAYPYQQQNWLSGIVEGTGSLAGGTGSTTYPGPNPVSQIAGLGLAGASVIGGTGGFGSNGWLTNLFTPTYGDQDFSSGSLAARGGRIGREHGGRIERQFGGLTPGISDAGVPGGSGLHIPTGVPDVSVSVIPQSPPSGNSLASAFLRGPSTAPAGGGGGGSGGSNIAGDIGTAVGLANLAKWAIALQSGGSIPDLSAGYVPAASKGSAGHGPPAPPNPQNAPGQISPMQFIQGLSSLEKLGVFDGKNPRNAPVSEQRGGLVLPGIGGGGGLHIGAPTLGGGIGVGGGRLHHGFAPRRVALQGGGGLHGSQPGRPTQQIDNVKPATDETWHDNWGQIWDEDPTASERAALAIAAGKYPSDTDFRSELKKISPHFEDGGMASPLSGAAPLAGSAPNVQAAYQQLTQQPIEKLRERAAQLVPGSVQARMVQRAIAAKEMTPFAGTQPFQPAPDQPQGQSSLGQMQPFQPQPLPGTSAPASASGGRIGLQTGGTPSLPGAGSLNTGLLPGAGGYISPNAMLPPAIGRSGADNPLTAAPTNPTQFATMGANSPIGLLPSGSGSTPSSSFFNTTQPHPYTPALNIGPAMAPAPTNPQLTNIPQVSWQGLYWPNFGVYPGEPTTNLSYSYTQSPYNALFNPNWTQQSFNAAAGIKSGGRIGGSLANGYQNGGEPEARAALPPPLPQPDQPTTRDQDLEAQRAASLASLPAPPSSSLAPEAATAAAPALPVVPPDSSVPVPPSLQPIYARESGGNYRAQNLESSASGAGQDLDATWREASHALGYGDQWAHAKDAPPDIQNAVNIWLQGRYGNRPWAASEPGVRHAGDMRGLAMPLSAGFAGAPPNLTGGSYSPSSPDLTRPPSFETGPAAPPHASPLTSSPWMIPLAVGAGMLASRSPYAGVALGEGLETGMKWAGQEEERGVRGEVAEARALTAQQVAARLADRADELRRWHEMQSQHQNQQLEANTALKEQALRISELVAETRLASAASAADARTAQAEITRVRADAATEKNVLTANTTKTFPSRKDPNDPNSPWGTLFVPEHPDPAKPNMGAVWMPVGGPPPGVEVAQERRAGMSPSEIESKAIEAARAETAMNPDPKAFQEAYGRYKNQYKNEYGSAAGRTEQPSSTQQWTRERPLVPKTQSDIDNAPPGSVIQTPTGLMVKP